ncbi:MAG: methionyl-tRNA formyltransferase [Lentimicrobium sp.]|nr:methionyl-tRNA formyltransferase [Lentimicrobium sp.]
MNKLRIIFMGTPEFAVEPLRQLIEHNFEIAAVVTVPDKPAGRGLKLKESAVKKFAISQNLPVLQPESLKNQEFISDLQSLKANLFIVVAFRKLPDQVWMMPEFGTFNLHASLLPQYRGAAPINHAVINGEVETGVTTFFINSGIDTGKIIMNRNIKIGPDETAGDIHDRLMITGAELVVETVKAIADGSCTVIDQPNNPEDLKPAPRIFREHCQIDWKKSAVDVHNLIRGLSPYPGAYSNLITEKGPLEVKILGSTLPPTIGKTMPGEVLILNNSRMIVSCSEGEVELLEIQASGKKAMKTDEFLRGLRSDLLRFEV